MPDVVYDPNAELYVVCGDCELGPRMSIVAEVFEDRDKILLWKCGCGHKFIMRFEGESLVIYRRGK